MMSPSLSDFQRLAAELEGALHFDSTMRALYATDASVYREMPQAVALPKTEGDICKLVRFARERGTSLIPRTAGTSLAGQVVGAGIVVDVSRHLTRILEIDETGRRVRVHPGVVRNELNLVLAPHQIFFAPETSTQNRCMIGGMVGNNACGANSVVYGSTRDHFISARAIHNGVGPTGIVANHASNHATVLCRGFRCKENLVRSKHEVKLIPHNTGMHPNAAPRLVDLQYASQVTRHIHYNACTNDLTGQRRASRSGYERCAAFTRKANELADISFGLGQGDSLRNLAINGCVGCIERPHR